MKMKLRKKLGAGLAAVALTASLSLAATGTAQANPVGNCGSSATPVLVSHPVSLMANHTRLGYLYLGYFGDCKGVYAEIHWQYGPSTPIASTEQQQGQDVFRPEGRVYLQDENGRTFGWTPFRLDHLDGSYTTSVIEDIHADPSGHSYAAPERFYPKVDLTVYDTDSSWHQSTLCAGKTLTGNYHDFYSGAWGSGNYGDCT